MNFNPNRLISESSYIRNVLYPNRLTSEPSYIQTVIYPKQSITKPSDIHIILYLKSSELSHCRIFITKTVFYLTPLIEKQSITRTILYPNSIIAETVLYKNYLISKQIYSLSVFTAEPCYIRNLLHPKRFTSDLSYI